VLLAEKEAGRGGSCAASSRWIEGSRGAHAGPATRRVAGREVTSGTFSPSKRVGIGLALLDPAVAEGDEVVVDVRGRRSSMRVVRPPFVEASTA
jgi:glycine cleavage system aminomethyltransferase T